MKIQLKIKNVYGNDRVYPVCEKGKIFAEIAGSTTLTLSTLGKIKALGYEFEYVSDTIESIA